MSMEVSSNYAGYYNNTLSDSKKESKQTVEVKSNTSASSKDKVQEKNREEQEEMAAFKKEFYADLERITNHRTVYSWSVNISDKAFENMKADLEYRAKILSLIQRDVGDSYAPRNCSVLIKVGAGSKDYSADSWPDCNDSEYHVRSQNSFYKRDNKKKDRTEEISERYLEKRAQAKKLQEKIMKEEAAKQELQHSRLMKEWYSGSHMTQASAAYEANITVESARSSVFES